MKIKLSILFLTTIIFILGYFFLPALIKMWEPYNPYDHLKRVVRYEEEGKVDKAIKGYREILAITWKNNEEIYLGDNFNNEELINWVSAILLVISEDDEIYSKLTTFSNKDLKEKYEKLIHSENINNYSLPQLSYEESIAFFNHLKFSLNQSGSKNVSVITVKTSQKKIKKALRNLVLDLRDYNNDGGVSKHRELNYSGNASDNSYRSGIRRYIRYGPNNNEFEVIIISAKNLIKLLDPKKDAVEILDLENKIKQLKKIRPSADRTQWECGTTSNIFDDIFYEMGRFFTNLFK